MKPNGLGSTEASEARGMAHPARIYVLKGQETLEAGDASTIRKYSAGCSMAHHICLWHIFIHESHESCSQSSVCCQQKADGHMLCGSLWDPETCEAHLPLSPDFILNA